MKLFDTISKKLSDNYFVEISVELKCHEFTEYLNIFI